MQGLVLVLLAGVVASSLGQSTSQLTKAVCSSKPFSSVHLSVSSLRNEEGNWVSKVDLERGGGRGQMEAMRTEPWSVGVDATTRTCEGAESILQLSLTLTAPLPIAKAGYELFPGLGYYKFHTTVTTWPLARQVCADEGAHLAIINSEKEHQILQTLFAQSPTIPGASSDVWAWIGMQKKGETFITIFGDALNTTGFLTWATGHPTKAVNECGLVHRKGGMAQVTCEGWRVAFFCEYEL